LNEYLITRLSKEHGVNREFIYQLRNQFRVWSVLIFGVLDERLFEPSGYKVNQDLITISQILRQFKLINDGFISLNYLKPIQSKQLACFDA